MNSTETSRYTTSRVDTVNVQGNVYKVESAIAVNGIMAGERMILRVDGNETKFYDTEELALIYERILSI